MYLKKHSGIFIEKKLYDSIYIFSILLKHF